MLTKLIGDTPQQVEARQARADLLSSGKTHVPYLWRPRAFISEARDIAQLWAMTKYAKGNDQRLILGMALNDWTACPWENMSNRVPLMDLLALLVAHDLGLLDMLFELFPKVAISQQTMIELGATIDPLAGFGIHNNCSAIRNTVKARFDQVLQPYASDSKTDGENAGSPSLDEISELSRQQPYILYSDDALFRVFCRQHDENFQSICALDVLTALESKGMLSPADVAEKIGALCGWGVGVVIEQRWQLASIPTSLNDAQNVKDGVEILKSSVACVSIFNGIWDRANASYEELQAHAGSLLSSMLSADTWSTAAIASLLTIWRDKTRRRQDAPSDDLTGLAALARYAILLQAEVSTEFSARLWEVYLALAAHEQGKLLDEEGLAEAILTVAFIAARNDLHPQRLSRQSLQSKFALGLIDQHSLQLIFKQSCELWRTTIAEKMMVGAPSFTYQGKAVDGQNYRQR